MSIQAYQLSGAGQASIPNPTVISPRSPTTTDIVSPAGNPYTLGQYWENTVSDLLFIYLGGGVWDQVASGSGTGPIDTLTGNTGGALSPTAGNINVLGTGTTTVVGSGSTLTITPTASGYPITPFVVGPVGKAGYQTIASAITAATATGGLVFIQPGTYTENLTLASGVFLEGASFQDVTIIGVHTPPASGTLNFKDITFQSATHVFSSAAAGSTAITASYCNFTITTGYIFNLTNWTGALQLFICGEVGSTTDGIVTNTGGSAITLLSCTVGAGTANAMTTSGAVIIAQASIQCPWSAATGTTFTVDTCEFSRTVTLANNSTGLFDASRFSTGATAAITMSSSAAVSLTNSIVNSSNNPAISGSGAGTLTIGSVTFLSNATIAATLTLAYVPTALSLTVATGSGAASGTVTCNGRQGSVTFTSPSIAAGATQTFTMANTAITGSGTAIIYTHRGATTGAALTIQSVTNSASQSAIVLTNGTGATTTTANITFDFIVLN